VTTLKEILHKGLEGGGLMPREPEPRRVSAVIIAQNEAARIGNAIRSCDTFADEVLVVDGGSEDETVRLSQELGAKIIHNPWPGYAAQRNFGAERAVHDWIFFLDADEVVGSTLAAALNRWKRARDDNLEGYAIYRVGDFLGSWMGGRRLGGEEIVRLYDRRHHHVKNLVLDEVIEVPPAKLGRMEGILWHYGFRSLAEHDLRFGRYGDIRTREAVTKGRKFSLARLLLRPPARFFQRYILRGMWRKGVPGLAVSLYWVHFEISRELKLFEAHWRSGGEEGRPPHEPPADAT
jgi:glycosyltransferase involved in cell wall biosynthesis